MQRNSLKFAKLKDLFLAWRGAEQCHYDRFLAVSVCTISFLKDGWNPEMKSMEYSMVRICYFDRNISPRKCEKCDIWKNWNCAHRACFILSQEKLNYNEKTRELYSNISIKLFSKVVLFTFVSVAKEGSMAFPFLLSCSS